MIRLIGAFFAFLIYLLYFNYSFASSFVSVVNPVRGQDFWSLENQGVETAVLGQFSILKKFGLPATWLIRFDALGNEKIINLIKSSDHEKGLFLEVTPTWTSKANVKYHQSEVWHFAGSVFLTGYSQYDRKKLIDTAFEKFKDTFGYYPKSVGAWWIDAYSLSYMEDKYKINASMIVADQFSTDNYQIWGQYFGTPYYPDKENALLPAQEIERKIPVVVLQWANRDPINGYGEGVQESTYSVQANDYTVYHNLKTDYFLKLIDIYTNLKFNSFGHVTVGLENSYSWSEFSGEYENQIKELAKKQNEGKIRIDTAGNFAAWYKSNFSKLSPPQIIVADDPLNTFQKAVWFMNPYYRAGWFVNNEGAVIRDLRQYVPGVKEPCFDNVCSELNFATTPTRVLDDVTFDRKIILDSGKIEDVNVKKKEDKFILSYTNEAGNSRIVEFFPRDISIDGKVSTIDTFILNALSDEMQKKALDFVSNQEFQKYKQSPLIILINIVKFLLFIILGILIPGLIFVSFIKNINLTTTLFLSICIGIVTLTAVSFISGLLNLKLLTPLYILISLTWYSLKLKKEYSLNKLISFFVLRIKNNLLFVFLVIAGTFFQSLAMIRSGWIYNFGLGFLGPTGHDNIWHQALVGQLINNIPPINPGFAGKSLINYHYFYDLLVSVTYFLTNIPIIELISRFYPIAFSLMLGFGTCILISRLSKSKLALAVGLFFVYFGSSFGWIVEFLRERHFGGESAFWMNQPVSMNLNPPFAISLVLLIGIVLMFRIVCEKRTLAGAIILSLLIGFLIEFKVYASILVLGSLFIISLLRLLKKDFFFLGVFALSLTISLMIFLPQNSNSSDLLILSPFWFINSMIDFPDRVGWLKLSQARSAYFERGEYLKFLVAEALGFLIFVFGNLGTRIVAFLGLPILFKKFQDSAASFMFLVTILSLVIPILFIQKGNPWNTIQFGYYGLYFMAIFSAIVLAGVFYKLPRSVAFIFIGIILLLTPISSIATFRSAFEGLPPAKLTFAEFEALNFLKEKSFGTVLTHPYDKNLRIKYVNPYPLFVYETSTYVSAFSEKPVFIEDEIQQEILQEDYKKRLVAAKDFFSGYNLSWSRQFLSENNIKYIYLLKVFNKNISEELGLEKVFENREVIIYEVKT